MRWAGGGGRCLAPRDEDGGSGIPLLQPCHSGCAARKRGSMPVGAPAGRVPVPGAPGGEGIMYDDGSPSSPKSQSLVDIASRPFQRPFRAFAKSTAHRPLAPCSFGLKRPLLLPSRLSASNRRCCGRAQEPRARPLEAQRPDVLPAPRSASGSRAPEELSPEPTPSADRTCHRD
jgi:hypothetical protein